MPDELLVCKNYFDLVTVHIIGKKKIPIKLFPIILRII